MRLHALEVTAFGPFAATQRVDLDALADAGLFLLHGPTGAGKTSVLDAVCYALYGVVPGHRQRAARLRSDHADPAVRTGVVLELTVGGRRLRVTRQPAWDRPKRRGSGTTQDPARTLVEELEAGSWAARTTRNDEAAHLLHALLGMSAAQFCQVVLLPQGQFADFLRADAEARRPILEQLFGTARFSAVEEWLAARRRDSAQRVASAHRGVEEVVARASEAACGLGGGGSPVPVAPAPGSPALAGAWAQALCAAADARARTAAAARSGAQRALAEAREERALLQRRHALQERHRAALLRAEELERGREAHEAAARVLEAGQRAEPVAALVAVERAARGRAAVAGSAVRAAAAALPPAEDDLLPDDLLPDDPAGSAERTGSGPRSAAAARGAGLLRERAARLDAVVLQERRAEQAGRELTDAREGVASARQRAAQAAGRCEDARQRVRALEEEVARLEPVAAAAPALAGEHAAAEQRHAAAGRRDLLAREAAAALAAARAAVDRAQAARHDWLDLREARLEAMAAELAQGLVVGGDCPVCGSPEHPSPAVHAAGAARVADAEAAAEQEHLARETERELAEAAAAQVQARHAAARAAAGGDVPVDDLRTTLTDLARRRELADAAAGALVRARRALQGARDERERAGGDAHEAALAVAAGQARCAALEAEAEELAAAVRRERGGAPSVAARRRRLRARADLLDALAAALAELAQAEAAVARAVADADRAARRAGFDDAAAALGAAQRLAAAGGPERLRAGAEAAAAARAAVAAQLADPELAAAAGQPVPDLAAAAARGAALDTACEAACAHDTRVQQAAAALAQHQDALAGLTARLGPLERDHAVVDGLSRLAEGTSTDNAKRMRLSAYVLAARLEQVAAAATERLLLMSAGRYSLVHTDEGAGRGRAGLGLAVVDAWTGQQRATTTLSGGESFSASLALALGLADVVAAEAGGARLGTLFVDEGFGSLDDQALDEVMDVLDGLRAGGRVVGIVSHVGDLRHRVPAQLRVAKGRAGSSLHATTG